MPNKVSVLNLAIMADRAYGDSKRPVPQGWREEPSQVYSALQLNYQIVPFINDKDKIVVLANRGTHIQDASGMLDFNNFLNDDLKIALGKNAKIYQFSLGTANMYRQKFKDKGYEIIHTGHSLGAAAATLVAAVNGEQAIGFDSPGVQTIVNSTLEIKNAIKKEADITLYQSAPNFINSSGEHLVGAKIINVKDSNSHKLDSIIKSIEKFSTEKYTIQSGDTLSKIAQNRYGLASQWQRIHQDNKAIIGENANSIRPGQQININYDVPQFK